MTDVSLASSPATGGGERLLPTASTLTAPTTPGSSTNNNINNNNLNNTRRGGGGGGGGHFSHQFNHHNLFVRQDRGIDGALPQHMKQLILEASPARLRGYDAEKVLVRTDQVFAVRDAKIIAADKERRSLVREAAREGGSVIRQGCCTNPSISSLIIFPA